MQRFHQKRIGELLFFLLMPIVIIVMIVTLCLCVRSASTPLISVSVSVNICLPMWVFESVTLCVCCVPAFTCMWDGYTAAIASSWCPYQHPLHRQAILPAVYHPLMCSAGVCVVYRFVWYRCRCCCCCRRCASYSFFLLVKWTPSIPIGNDFALWHLMDVGPNIYTHDDMRSIPS